MFLRHGNHSDGHPNVRGTVDASRSSLGVAGRSRWCTRRESPDTSGAPQKRGRIRSAGGVLSQLARVSESTNHTRCARLFGPRDVGAATRAARVAATSHRHRYHRVVGSAARGLAYRTGRIARHGIRSPRAASVGHESVVLRDRVRRSQRSARARRAVCRWGDRSVGRVIPAQCGTRGRDARESARDSCLVDAGAHESHWRWCRFVAVRIAPDPRSKCRADGAGRKSHR